MLYPDPHLKGKKKGRKTRRHERSQGFSAETRNQNVPGRCESNRNPITNRKEACNQPPQARIIRPTSDPNPPPLYRERVDRRYEITDGSVRDPGKQTTTTTPRGHSNGSSSQRTFYLNFRHGITIRDCRHVQTPTVADLHSYIST